MAHCKECKNSIFVAQEGEFKCKEYKRTIYNPSYQPDVCKKFTKGEPSESAENKLYEELLEN